MAQLPNISETEWEIMKILWERSPLGASEIFIALAERDSSWHPKTAKTLLSRLVKKRAVGFRKDGRGYLYRPLVTEAECAGAESESFLDRVFEGSLTPMLAHFVKHRKLSKEEMNELRSILDDKA